MDYLSGLLISFIIIILDADEIQIVLNEILKITSMQNDNSDRESFIKMKLIPVVVLLFISFIIATPGFQSLGNRNNNKSHKLESLKVSQLCKKKRQLFFYSIRNDHFNDKSTTKLTSLKDSMLATIKLGHSYTNKNGSNIRERRDTDYSLNSTKGGCCCGKTKKVDSQQCCISKEAAPVYRNQPLPCNRLPEGIVIQVNPQCKNLYQRTGLPCNQPIYNQRMNENPCCTPAPFVQNHPCECQQQRAPISPPVQHPRRHSRDITPCTERVSKQLTQTSAYATPKSSPIQSVSQLQRDLSAPMQVVSQTYSCDDQSPPREMVMNRSRECEPPRNGPQPPYANQSDVCSPANGQPAQQVVYMDLSPLEAEQQSLYYNRPQDQNPPRPYVYNPPPNDCPPPPCDIYPAIPAIPDMEIARQSHHSQPQSLAKTSTIQQQQQPLYQSMPPLPTRQQPIPPPQKPPSTYYPPEPPPPQTQPYPYYPPIQPQQQSMYRNPPSSQPLQTYGGSTNVSDGLEPSAAKKGCCAGSKKPTGRIHAQTHGYKVDGHLRMKGKKHGTTISIPEDSYLITR